MKIHLYDYNCNSTADHDISAGANLKVKSSPLNI